MKLKFEIAKLEDAEEQHRGFYEAHNGKFRLKVEGLDPADELKEALRKEREERAAAKQRLQEIEAERETAERERMEREQEYKSLYEKEQDARSNVAKELDELKRKIADKERREAASGVVSSLTRDTARADLLLQQAMGYIAHTPEGVKINGPDGEAWDAGRLADHLKNKYPFLADGNQSNGGGAAGSKGGGATGKKFNELSGAELSVLRKQNPAEYDRLKRDYYGD